MLKTSHTYVLTHKCSFGREPRARASDENGETVVKKKSCEEYPIAKYSGEICMRGRETFFDNKTVSIQNMHSLTYPSTEGNILHFFVIGVKIINRRRRKK